MANENKEKNIVKIDAEVKVIEVSFNNKKAGKRITQHIVKIPRRITDGMNITNKNSIYFEIREDTNKKPYLYMELR